MTFLPELKAEAKIACRCFTYLLVKGYKADQKLLLLNWLRQ